MSDLVPILPQQNAQMVLRPVIPVSELIAIHKEIAILIRDGLQEGIDYGTIPGTGGKPTLFKPGAERICTSFGCTASYQLIKDEVDHGFENSWTDKYGQDHKARGLYSYLYRCVIEKDKVFRGDSQGFASTIESKWRSRPYDTQNTVAKMAEKRAFVGAVLSTFGLSGRFTQDVEDTHIVATPRPTLPSQSQSSPEVYQATDAQKVYFKKLAGDLGVTERERLLRASNMCLGTDMHLLKAALLEIFVDGITPEDVPHETQAQPMVQ